MSKKRGDAVIFCHNSKFKLCCPSPRKHNLVQVFLRSLNWLVKCSLNLRTHNPVDVCEESLDFGVGNDLLKAEILEDGKGWREHNFTLYRTQV